MKSSDNTLLLAGLFVLIVVIIALIVYYTRPGETKTSDQTSDTTKLTVENLTFDDYEEISDFDREFIRAKNITSFAGELCKLAGGLGMFFGIIFTFYALASGSLIAGISGIGISFGLAIAGAPLMALGTIATNSKKQTALISLQTKQIELLPKSPDFQLLLDFILFFVFSIR